MKSLFSKLFIMNHEILFWTFVAVIVLMIIISFIFVGKELKKENDNK